MRAHKNGHDRYSREAFIQYIEEQFGEEADTYLLNRNEQQVLFGQIVRLLREARRLPQESPKEKRTRSLWTQPQLFGASGGSKTAGNVPPEASQDDDGSDAGESSKGMPQAELAAAMQSAWWYLNHERKYFDASWVRRLERGAVIVDRPLILCLAYSLGAEAKEIAILLEAAGYNGWNAYKAHRLKAPRATILGWLEEGADNHRSKKFAPTDILTLLKYRMEAEIRDALPRDDPHDRDGPDE